MKRTMPSWLRSTALVVAVAMSVHAMTAPARGGLLESQPLAVGGGQAADLARVQQVLEMKIVQQRLQDLGFSPAEVQLRLQRADPADLHQFAVQSDQLLAGGHGYGLGIVVTLLVIALLVILILKINDKKIVIT